MYWAAMATSVPARRTASVRTDLAGGPECGLPGRTGAAPGAPDLPDLPDPGRRPSRGPGHGRAMKVSWARMTHGAQHHRGIASATSSRGHAVTESDRCAVDS